MFPKKQNRLILILLFYGSVSIFGQELLVNTGEFSVAPETVMGIYLDYFNTEEGVFNNDGDVHIHGHFTNHGLVTFSSEEQGLTQFIGTNVQRLDGDMPSDFYHIRFNNPAQQPAFQLVSDIAIYGEAEFVEGIVDGADYGGTVVFQNGSYHTSVSDVSHVDGQVRKIGDEAFQFPIGDAQYFRRADISAPEMESDQFTAQYFLEDTQGPFPHEQKESTIDIIDSEEFWTIERTQGNSNAIITLSWHQATTPADILAHLNGLHVVGWDEDQELWIDYGGLVHMESQTVSTVLPIAGYGTFTLATTLRPSDHTAPIVYDIISPDEDGINDYLEIENIEAYPINTLEIYNRWGVKVFETEGYGQHDTLFRGFSDGRLTVKRQEELPEGTYYYVLNYQDEAGNLHRKAGGIFINR